MVEMVQAMRVNPKIHISRSRMESGEPRPVSTGEPEPSSSRVTYAGKLALSQWRDGEDERRTHETNR